MAVPVADASCTYFMAAEGANYLTECRRRLQSVPLEEFFGLVDEDTVAREQCHATLLAVSDLDHPAVQVCRGVARDWIEERCPTVAE